MARYCAHCGNQLTEGEKFCPVCGSPVEQPAAPARPEGGKNTAPQPGPRSQQPAGSFQPKGDLPHQSGRGKWIALVIGLMLGWIYERSGSLKVCIAAHMCVDLLAVFL